MRQLDELARYSIIVGYLQFFKSGGSILDVGCGEGILQEKMSACGYSKYAGIDISQAAINKVEKVKANYSLLDESRTRHESKAWICNVFVPPIADVANRDDLV